MGYFYFKDRNGCELKHPLQGCELKHPLQGVPASSTGSAVATDGTMVCDGPDKTKWTDKEGRIARTEISGFTRQRGEGWEYVDITINNFDGYMAVLVKAWYPRTEYNEEFWLIGSDGCAAIAEQTRKRGSAG